MSLYVYLYPPDIQETSQQKAVKLLRENGFGSEANILESLDYPDAVGCYFSSNITHNLGKMAGEAGIYKHLWRPEEIGITKASQLIAPLREAVVLMKSDRARFEKFNAPNGWGLYENFVPFVEEYLRACVKYPDADIRVSR